MEFPKFSVYTCVFESICYKPFVFPDGVSNIAAMHTIFMCDKIVYSEPLPTL